MEPGFEARVPASGLATAVNLSRVSAAASAANLVAKLQRSPSMSLVEGLRNRVPRSTVSSIAMIPGLVSWEGCILWDIKSSEPHSNRQVNDHV